MITEPLAAQSQSQSQSQKRISTDIEKAYKKYNKMIYQVSFSYMKNKMDAEDTVEDTFVKLMKHGANFQSEEHEKAWLLRTAINLCKNNLKHWRRKFENIDDHENLHDENQFKENEILEAVIKLPDRYKAAIYLYYYEGYTTAEIAQILKKPHSSVRVHLHKAKKILKEVLTNEK